MTLYAVWGNLSQPILRVKSANPAEGSITLAWDDGTDGQCVSSYSIYRGPGPERLPEYFVEGGITDTEWTDNDYWNAEPVLSPLNYWVVAESDYFDLPASNAVETRHRYGLFVGVGEYEGIVRAVTGLDWFDPSPDPTDIDNARLFSRLAQEQGGYTVAMVITGANATVEIVRTAMKSLAEIAKTGDFITVFLSSHGNKGEWESIRNGGWKLEGIDLYDDIYKKKDVGGDFSAILEGKNGVSVLAVVNACLSGGVVSCLPPENQVACITSCQETEVTTTYANNFGTPLPKYLLDYGWCQGQAGNSDALTFAELADYAIPKMETFHRRIGKTAHPVVRGDDVLEHFIAGRPGSAVHSNAPNTPTGLMVSQGGEELTLSWNSVPDADYIILMVTDESDHVSYVGMIDGDKTSGTDGEASRHGTSYRYRIAAMNEHGISPYSGYETGNRIDKGLVNWLRDKGDFILTTAADVAAAALSSSRCGETMEACYVAGLDPADESDKFTTTIEIGADGKPIVSWSPDLNEGGTKSERVYRILGAKSLGGEWDDVTDVSDPDAEGYRFFKATVELP